MIVDRLKQYIDTKGIPIATFERSVGMSNASFGKSLKNKGAIGTDKLENILSIYPDISPSWLLTGEGPMLREASPKADMPKVEASVQTKTGKTKASASAPGTADSAFFMDYIRTKDTMIEQKSQEIASLTGKVARLEAECAFLREQLSRLQG